MSLDGSAVDGAVILVTGVACAVALLDATRRYFRRPAHEPERDSDEENCEEQSSETESTDLADRVNDDTRKASGDLLDSDPVTVGIAESDCEDIEVVHGRSWGEAGNDSRTENARNNGALNNGALNEKVCEPGGTNSRSEVLGCGSVSDTSSNQGTLDLREYAFENHKQTDNGDVSEAKCGSGKANPSVLGHEVDQPKSNYGKIAHVVGLSKEELDESEVLNPENVSEIPLEAGSTGKEILESRTSVHPGRENCEILNSWDGYELISVAQVSESQSLNENLSESGSVDRELVNTEAASEKSIFTRDSREERGGWKKEISQGSGKIISTNKPGSEEEDLSMTPKAGKTINGTSNIVPPKGCTSKPETENTGVSSDGALSISHTDIDRDIEMESMNKVKTDDVDRSEVVICGKPNNEEACEPLTTKGIVRGGLLTQVTETKATDIGVVNDIDENEHLLNNEVLMNVTKYNKDISDVDRATQNQDILDNNAVSESPDMLNVDTVTERQIKLDVETVTGHQMKLDVDTVLENQETLGIETATENQDTLDVHTVAENQNILDDDRVTENQDALTENVETPDVDTVTENVETQDVDTVTGSVETQDVDTVTGSVETQDVDTVTENVETHDVDVVTENVETHDVDVVTENVETPDVDVVTESKKELDINTVTFNQDTWGVDTVTESQDTLCDDTETERHIKLDIDTLNDTPDLLDVDRATESGETFGNNLVTKSEEDLEIYMKTKSQNISDDKIVNASKYTSDFELGSETQDALDGKSANDSEEMLDVGRVTETQYKLDVDIVTENKDTLDGKLVPRIEATSDVDTWTDCKETLNGKVVIESDDTSDFDTADESAETSDDDDDADTKTKDKLEDAATESKDRLGGEAVTEVYTDVLEVEASENKDMLVGKAVTRCIADPLEGEVATESKDMLDSESPTEGSNDVLDSGETTKCTDTSNGDVLTENKDMFSNEVATVRTLGVGAVTNNKNMTEISDSVNAPGETIVQMSGNNSSFGEVMNGAVMKSQQANKILSDSVTDNGHKAVLNSTTQNAIVEGGWDSHILSQQSDKHLATDQGEVTVKGNVEHSTPERVQNEISHSNTESTGSSGSISGNKDLHKVAAGGSESRGGLVLGKAKLVAKETIDSVPVNNNHISDAIPEADGSKNASATKESVSKWDRATSKDTRVNTPTSKDTLVPDDTSTKTQDDTLVAKDTPKDDTRATGDTPIAETSTGTKAVPVPKRTSKAPATGIPSPVNPTAIGKESWYTDVNGTIPFGAVPPTFTQIGQTSVFDKIINLFSSKSTKANNDTPPGNKQTTLSESVDTGKDRLVKPSEQAKTLLESGYASDSKVTAKQSNTDAKLLIRPHRPVVGSSVDLELSFADTDAFSDWGESVDPPSEANCAPAIVATDQKQETNTSDHTRTQEHSNLCQSASVSSSPANVSDACTARDTSKAGTPFENTKDPNKTSDKTCKLTPVLQAVDHTEILTQVLPQTSISFSGRSYEQTENSLTSEERAKTGNSDADIYPDDKHITTDPSHMHLNSSDKILTLTKIQAPEGTTTRAQIVQRHTSGATNSSTTPQPVKDTVSQNRESLDYITMEMRNKPGLTQTRGIQYDYQGDVDDGTGHDPSSGKRAGMSLREVLNMNPRTIMGGNTKVTESSHSGRANSVDSPVAGDAKIYQQGSSFDERANEVTTTESEERHIHVDTPITSPRSPGIFTNSLPPPVSSRLKSPPSIGRVYVTTESRNISATETTRPEPSQGPPIVPRPDPLSHVPGATIRPDSASQGWTVTSEPEAISPSPAMTTRHNSSDKGPREAPAESSTQKVLKKAGLVSEPSEENGGFTIRRQISRGASRDDPLKSVQQDARVYESGTPVDRAQTMPSKPQESRYGSWGNANPDRGWQETTRATGDKLMGPGVVQRERGAKQEVRTTERMPGLNGVGNDEPQIIGFKQPIQATDDKPNLKGVGKDMLRGFEINKQIQVTENRPTVTGVMTRQEERHGRYDKHNLRSTIKEEPQTSGRKQHVSSAEDKSIMRGVVKEMPHSIPIKPIDNRTAPRESKTSHTERSDVRIPLPLRNLVQHDRKSHKKGSRGLEELTKMTKPEGNVGYLLRRNILQPGISRESLDNLSLVKEKDTIGQDLKVLEMANFAEDLENLDNTSVDPDYDNGELLEDLSEAMRTNVKIASEINLDQFPRGFREKLEGIRDISGSFQALSDEITTKALALLDQDSESNDDKPEADLTSEQQTPHDPLAEVFKRRAYLRSQWLGLRRLLFCVDLQLRHAAGYHLFFEDAKALKRLMLDFHKQLQHEEVEEAMAEEDESARDSRVDLEKLRKTGAYLQSLQTNVQDVVKRSANIVPMRRRKEPLSEPLDIQCVSALASEKFDLGEGEPLKLIDNTAPYTWRVQNAAGQQDDIPAAYCVIPPPDPDAVLAAAQLEEALSALMDRYIETMRRRLLKYSKGVLNPILDKADPLLQQLTPERKQEVLSDLLNLDDACEDLFSTMAGYPKLEEVEFGLKDAVRKARLSLSEDPRVQDEVAEPIVDLYHMLEELQDLVKKRQAARDFAIRYGLENYLDNDNLDWVVELLDNPDRGVAISVQHQETQVMETTTFTSTTGEVRQTFSVTAVLDPRYNRHLSMDEATASGLLDQRGGVYVHPLTRAPIPIQAAINAGLIVVDGLQTKLIHGPTKEVGLVTVSVTRENRPYTIKRVRDPHTNEELNVVEAIERGIFDASRGMWINPAINEQVSAKNAIDSGLLIVEYDKEEQSNPEVITRTFAVYAIMDRRLGKRIPFEEACQKHIINKEEGIYYDNRSGMHMHVIDAAKHGYVKLRVLESIVKLERFVSRDRSDSLDSMASGSSFG